MFVMAVKAVSSGRMWRWEQKLGCEGGFWIFRVRNHSGLLVGEVREIWGRIRESHQPERAGRDGLAALPEARDVAAGSSGLKVLTPVG